MEILFMVLCGSLVGASAAPTRTKGSTYYWIYSGLWVFVAALTTAALFSLMTSEQISYQAYGIYMLTALVLGGLAHLVRHLHDRQRSSGSHWS